MSEFKVNEQLVIPNDSNVDAEIWLEPEEAKNLARKLINVGAMFTYLPDVDDTYTQIIASIEDIALCVTMTLQVNP